MCNPATGSWQTKKRERSGTARKTRKKKKKEKKAAAKEKKPCCPKTARNFTTSTCQSKRFLKETARKGGATSLWDNIEPDAKGKKEKRKVVDDLQKGKEPKKGKKKPLQEKKGKPSMGPTKKS